MIQLILKNWWVSFHQNENSCPSKDNVKRIKRQITDWGKIFVDFIADKGLVSKIRKTCSKLKKKHITHFFKWA